MSKNNLINNPLSQLSKSDFINSNNFLTNSDTFYGAYVQNEDLSKLDSKNYRVLINENGSSLIKNRSFSLKENDVIFCHTMLLIPLFNHLNKVKEFRNIKLITHQSDLSIDRKLFSKKPKCISKWYAINVRYSHENLIPIPIGIGNDSNQKTLTSNNYKNLNFELTKVNKVYANFNMNTNYFHRYKATKKLINHKFMNFDKPNLNLDKFIHRLSQHKFCLAPWGNGYDTHRLWEALYAGVIPITKSHKSLDCFNEFPILYFKKFKELNIEDLNQRTYKFNPKLNINYWIKQINEGQVESQNISLNFKENDEMHKKNIRIFFKKYHKLNRYKYLKTLLRKIHKKLLGKQINIDLGV